MSFANVSFPPEKIEALRSAVRHYEFGNPTNFFRICGEMLIEHHERGDALNRPLGFSKNGYASPQKTQKAHEKTH